MTPFEAATSDTGALTPADALDRLRRIDEALSQVVVGQSGLMRRLLTALFAAIPYSFASGEERAGCGHVLIEGVPGVAKTLTATTLARLISADFQRIQLTPDLMPADVIGTRIYDATASTFRVERGPVFTNILLADEINRATPKTQSALLEAMQERQVTIADATFTLPDPFWVLATQNPVEHEGVYLLPEAQLDRFSMMVRVGYPTQADELRMLRQGTSHVTLEHLVTPSDVVAIRQLIQQQVHVDDKIPEYIVRLGHATRKPADVGLEDLQELLLLGLSPRSYQHVLALSRVTAFLEGRDHVLPADVKAIFPDVARHRLVRSVRAEAEAIETDSMVARILDAVPIP
ncbi:MAG: AAA family ATPase [Acidobacteriota bacterium]|nr:AAA family ATPase [Acidobacteriota bacterium]